MSSKLYVGNLSFDVTEEGLSEIFSPFGTVKSAKIIMDRDTGRSRGFGFVEMSSDEEAQNSISELDGKESQGRTLRVSEAKEREERPRNGGNRGPRGGGNRGGGFGGGNRRF